MKRNLKYILERNLREIIEHYGSYVDCLRGIIEEKRISPKALRTYLLTLSAFSESSTNQSLTLMSEKKYEFQKAETIPDIFTVLVTECASFLNYEIFESIIRKYKIKRQKYKSLQYPELLRAYVLKHKISEFIEINPLLKSRKGSKELTIKYDVESSRRLAKVIDLEKFIANIFGLLPSALEIVDIKDGCAIITFSSQLPLLMFSSLQTQLSLHSKKRSSELPKYFGLHAMDALFILKEK